MGLKAHGVVVTSFVPKLSDDVTLTFDIEVINEKLEWKMKVFIQNLSFKHKVLV